MSSALINKFYTAFRQKDFRAMQSCYHPDVMFSDEVFPSLQGKKAMAMWHMLLMANEDPHQLLITFTNVKADSEKGSCDWEAVYDFSLTRRKVHNMIHARFIFKDDLIIRHADAFNFWRWSRMAFGFMGFAIGWSPFFRKKIQKSVAARLEKFIQKNPEYQ